MSCEGELSFGVTTRVELSAHNRLFECLASVQISDEIRHTMRAHGRQHGIEAARAQRGDFIERAAFHHAIEARFDARIESLAFGREEKGRALRSIEQRGAAGTLKGSERLACRFKNFQRAQDALRVRLAQARSGFGVALGEFGVKLLRALACAAARTRARTSSGTAECPKGHKAPP